MKYVHILIVCILLVWVEVPADAKEPQTVSEKLSYSAGFQLGEHFRKQKLKVRTDMVMSGLETAIRGERPVMTKGEMRVLLSDPKKALYTETNTFRQENRKMGKEFLNRNAEKEGVVVLPSGVQYKILRRGNGKQPEEQNTVQMHYRGENLEGYVFADTYKDGQADEMEVEMMVPGIAEALLLMKEGGKWEIYIPEDLAYGSHGPLANKTLIYQLELLTVSSTE